VGIAHQFGFGQLLLSYGHSDGNFYGANISDRTMGDQVGLGISAPVALGQALRVTGRFIYGGYTSKGVRATTAVGQLRRRAQQCLRLWRWAGNPRLTDHCGNFPSKITPPKIRKLGAGNIALGNLHPNLPTPPSTVIV
jgi:hypothetical protein